MRHYPPVEIDSPFRSGLSGRPSGADYYGKPKPNSHSELSLLEALSLPRVRSEAVKTRAVNLPPRRYSL
jgi:hypothetical protein